jgi:hypothetical protein
MSSHDKGWKVLFVDLPKWMQGKKAAVILAGMAAIAVGAAGYGVYCAVKKITGAKPKG